MRKELHGFGKISLQFSGIAALLDSFGKDGETVNSLLIDCVFQTAGCVGGFFRRESEDFRKEFFEDPVPFNDFSGNDLSLRGELNGIMGIVNDIPPKIRKIIWGFLEILLLLAKQFTAISITKRQPLLWLR